MTPAPSPARALGGGRRLDHPSRHTAHLARPRPPTATLARQPHLTSRGLGATETDGTESVSLAARGPGAARSHSRRPGPGPGPVRNSPRLTLTQWLRDAGNSTHAGRKVLTTGTLPLTHSVNSLPRLPPS